MDIVERLREHNEPPFDYIAHEAANEIEQLRKDYALAWENHILHEQIFVLTEAKIERLREALRFYADPDNYEWKVSDTAVMSNVEYTEIIIDDGAKARAALKESE